MLVERNFFVTFNFTSFWTVPFMFDISPMYFSYDYFFVLFYYAWSTVVSKQNCLPLRSFIMSITSSACAVFRSKCLTPSTLTTSPLLDKPWRKNKTVHLWHLWNYRGYQILVKYNYPKRNTCIRETGKPTLYSLWINVD